MGPLHIQNVQVDPSGLAVKFEVILAFYVIVVTELPPLIYSKYFQF